MNGRPAGKRVPEWSCSEKKRIGTGVNRGKFIKGEEVYVGGQQEEEERENNIKRRRRLKTRKEKDEVFE